MKKILSLFLTTAMSLSMIAGSAFASDFTDIKDSDQYEAIEVLGTIGLVEGVSDSIFDPEGTLTRAELCTMMVRAICDKNEIFYNDTKVFDDVKYNHWARIYIETAVRNGIMNGCGNNEFRPDESLTYVQAARTVLNALGYGELNWPTGVNAVAYQLDLYENIPMVDFDTDCTRAHAAQMIYNAFNCELVNEYAGQHFGTGKNFLNDTLGFTISYGVNDNDGKEYIAYVKDGINYLINTCTSTEKEIYAWYESNSLGYYSEEKDVEKRLGLTKDILIFKNGNKINYTDLPITGWVQMTGILDHNNELISIIWNEKDTYLLPGEKIPNEVKMNSDYNPYISTVICSPDGTYTISNNIKFGIVTEITDYNKVTLTAYDINGNSSNYSFVKDENDDTEINLGNYVTVFFTDKAHKHPVGYKVFKASNRVGLN